MADLPITTTKRGIDSSKDIYVLVRQRMQEGLKYFTRNTNRWKGFESELRYRFDRSSVLDLRELKRVIGKLPFTALHGNGKVRQYKPQLPEKNQLETTRRICFVKEVADIHQVSQFLFDDTRKPAEVGEACFEAILRDAKR